MCFHTEMSEVMQCERRHAEPSQSRTQIFPKHVEVAVELGCSQVQFFKCYLITKRRRGEGTV